MMRKLYQRPWLAGLAAAGLALGLAAAPTAARTEPYAGWRLPLPAGAWVISRGPCGSPADYNHECGYYEDQCAVDLIPAAGSMLNVPVLAPQAGQVLYLGQRNEPGQMLMVQHADGRVSVYMHLERIVVALDERVMPGQVLAYAGGSGIGEPHLHFYVQPNAVERACVSLAGLETLDFLEGRAYSRNRAWSELVLPDPPAALPGWLAGLAGPGAPPDLALTPGAVLTFPVAISGAVTTLNYPGGILPIAGRSGGLALFAVPLTAPRLAGAYALTVSARAGVQARINYTVRPASAVVTAPPALLINAELVAPTGWSAHAAAPRLCWRLPQDRRQPIAARFRVVLTGPLSVNGPWQTEACWQPPVLPAGAYLWKVQVRGPEDALNRPNQRPFAFVIR